LLFQVLIYIWQVFWVDYERSFNINLNHSQFSVISFAQLAALSLASSIPCCNGERNLIVLRILEFFRASLNFFIADIPSPSLHVQSATFFPERSNWIILNDFNKNIKQFSCVTNKTAFEHEKGFKKSWKEPHLKIRGSYSPPNIIKNQYIEAVDNLWCCQAKLPRLWEVPWQVILWSYHL